MLLYKKLLLMTFGTTVVLDLGRWNVQAEGQELVTCTGIAFCLLPPGGTQIVTNRTGMMLMSCNIRGSKPIEQFFFK